MVLSANSATTSSASSLVRNGKEPIDIAKFGKAMKACWGQFADKSPREITGPVALGGATTGAGIDSTGTGATSGVLDAGTRVHAGAAVFRGHRPDVRPVWRVCQVHKAWALAAAWSAQVARPALQSPSWACSSSLDFQSTCGSWRLCPPAVFSFVGTGLVR